MNALLATKVRLKAKRLLSFAPALIDLISPFVAWVRSSPCYHEYRATADPSAYATAQLSSQLSALSSLSKVSLSLSLKSRLELRRSGDSATFAVLPIPHLSSPTTPHHSHGDPSLVGSTS